MSIQPYSKAIRTFECTFIHLMKSCRSTRIIIQPERIQINNHNSETRRQHRILFHIGTGCYRKLRVCHSSCTRSTSSCLNTASPELFRRTERRTFCRCSDASTRFIECSQLCKRQESILHRSFCTRNCLQFSFLSKNQHIRVRQRRYSNNTELIYYQQERICKGGSFQHRKFQNGPNTHSNNYSWRRSSFYSRLEFKAENIIYNCYQSLFQSLRMHLECLSQTAFEVVNKQLNR
ncbi:Hypothetical_protein [Hexamita inflata]|uniref:Hypothetical_protein n=1 Tax=Hexamita inflata TaxID=28002 RepID=A0AA86UA54_9EUKA|nr:Hypothetical protein HINF_LOCUS31022 [Hexamita inflata]